MCWWSERTMSFSAKSSKPGKGRVSSRSLNPDFDPGDWVVTEGTQRAFAGAKVAPQRSELTSVAADPSDKSSVADPAPK